jgi:hypothetical protein
LDTELLRLLNNFGNYADLQSDALLQAFATIALKASGSKGALRIKPWN